ncbi:pyroglutamyl-peptidase I [Chthonomonas calidirosea]|uniref:pyroglutamyl-peptidase I n=1 Tax=Chthonomonas calidirosea TaxID=454171 RepID=UPI0006EC706A|nr:pyroglutamyl-peptidase I [Chthonomonas calidirosea]CEK16297.1 pyroglutamyl-peptidase I [Chthonomonas calidirosea]
MGVQILLTGFGPFGAVVQNPSQRLVRYFGRHPIEGIGLTAITLPVSYTQAPCTVETLIRQRAEIGHPFDYVLMLGVAANSSFWRVERKAHNRASAKLDVDETRLAPGPITPGAPATLEATLPVQQLVEAMNGRGIPAHLSDDAGDYLCNYLFFRVLYLLAQLPTPPRAGFLHIPADESTFRDPEHSPAPIFPFEQHVLALETVLHTLAALSTGRGADAGTMSVRKGDER